MGMNEQEDTNADCGGEMVVGYSSRDFEFVLACMSRDDVDVRVLQMVPEPKRAGKMDQVRMHLMIYKDGKPMDNSVPLFERLRIEYQNNEFRVNPRRFSEHQRTLRSMTIDVLERARMQATAARKPSVGGTM